MITIKKSIKERLIKFEDIDEEIVKIDISKCSFISKSGNVYTDYGDGYVFPVRTFINKHNGYLYVNFKDSNGEVIQRRVHILVARAFIPNPDNLPYVCHKDNNKGNPCVDNLEWGDASYNTKNAFRDGLIVNARGWEDSQSKPVSVYTEDGKLFKYFGSVSEASRALNITKHGILYQCKNLTKSKPRKKFYFRFYNDYNDDFLIL